MSDFSIKDVEQRIPTDALNWLRETMPAEFYRDYLNTIRTNRVSTFRINTLLGETNTVLNELRSDRIKFKDFPTLKGLYILESSENEFKKTNAFKEGKLYMQGASGIFPVLALNPQENETILDVAAAPGSKTSLIAAMMNNTGHIDAIEPDFIRMERLKFNCNQMGVQNIEFFQTKAQHYNSEKQYDAILADVPCSGEGRFNLSDRLSYAKWTRKGVDRFAKLQLSILSHAVQFLKPGGRLIYSTCTLNPIENEGVLCEFLKENPGFTSAPLNLPQDYPREVQFVSKQNLHYIRVYPSKLFEGFFIASLQN